MKNGEYICAGTGEDSDGTGERGELESIHELWSSLEGADWVLVRGGVTGARELVFDGSETRLVVASARLRVFKENGTVGRDLGGRVGEGREGATRTGSATLASN